MLSARQAISQSRKSRGLFSALFRSNGPAFKPTYNFQPSGTACRVYGTVNVKKVTGKFTKCHCIVISLFLKCAIANLHITTAGHGYSSPEHVDHNCMHFLLIVSVVRSNWKQ
jgi:endoplasmic reticulum-Golgi intermediate compartment protein 2